MRILTISPLPKVLLWLLALIFWLLPRGATAQCLATRTIAEGGTVVATTTGDATAPYSTLYILTDGSGVVADNNATGSFTIATAGNYRIYILNYDTGNVPTNVPPTVGSNISAITGGCFNTADFTTEYLCVVVNSANCIATRTICAGDALSVTTTGQTTAVGYTTVYVLVDNATGLVVASNATGVFTADVTGGNAYSILTLNYDTANPPSPLPTNAGDDPSTIGTTTAGCYNGDFLTEQLCVTVDNCASGCVATRTISQGDPLSVSTTGNNTTAGYSTVFILADAVTGIVVSSNTTGVFTNDVTCGESYAILTLNYDTANPPSPLPTNAGDGVTTIGSTTAGCYNSDFLAAFLCVNVNPCANCVSTRTFCAGDVVSVSTTGNTTIPGYVTLFVLVNQTTGLVVASNSTGIFTSDVVGGNSYEILTLNYNASSPPAPLPTNPGDDPTTIGNATAGCYNGDFLTERLCLTVNNCCTANAGDIDQVEMCQGATAPTDLTPLTPSYGGGFGPAPSPAADYSYAYFIAADAAPNAILQGPVATANLFTYNTLAAGTYRVYGFSYRTAQGPLTNTTAGSPILGVGLTGGTCYEATFTNLVVNPIPAPPTLSDAVYCTGQAAAALDATTSGAVSYSWSDASTAPTLTPSTATAAVTTYAVTVTGIGGCTATQDAQITVNQTPTATITPSGPTTVCAPATVDLTASGGGTYAWSTGAATATITASATGTYTVTVTNNGCTATASQAVTVNSATASITPSGPTTFCTGGSVVLVANGGGTYAWSTGAATATITASTTGTYTVTVTNNGCTATASQAVTANNAPTADAGADQSICSGQSATLTATGGGTYLWSTGEATASINVSPASATIYTVTVTGVGGCTASDAVSVAVSTTPTATASNNGPVCDTRDIILSASGGSTYAWSGPNGFSSTSQTSVILSGSPQFPGVGTWTYTVTVTNGTCSATASTTITVNASPSITASSNSPVCVGSTIQLTSNYSNPTGGDIYAWTGPNGFSSSQANPTISNASILNGGVYTLTVANQFSCTSATTTTVTIANTPNANITSNVVCNGGIATVNLLVASAGGGSTYAWSGTGATGTGNSQTIVGLAPGLQTYTITITNASGCTASGTTTVNVPSCFVCNAVAGTVSVSNGCVGSPLAASVSGNNTTAGYTTQFIVTNTAGTIVYIGAAPINGLAAGNYLLYSYNYSVQPTPAPAVGGSIADYVTNTNNTGCYDVSNGMAFTVAAAAPALVGASSLSQGNGGGTSPFYYNIEVLTVEGGTTPYNFQWDNTGYVRYDIAYGDADGDGIADATITVYYSDNAYWNVTVTDAGACGNSTPVVFTNEPGGGTDLLLDIINYVITAQSGTTNNGAVDITVSGGGAGCTPYSYAWSGPNGFTATTEDISSLEYGWYSVTVTCADGSENTVGWYWVPRNRRGRSKTDGDMVGLAAMPNPFNSQTNIEFYVSQDAHTTVSVFAADGKRVAVLFSDRAVADEVYSVSLDGGSLPAGVYTVVMNTDTGEVQTYKVILTK